MHCSLPNNNNRKNVAKKYVRQQNLNHMRNICQSKPQAKKRQIHCFYNNSVNQKNTIELA